MNKFYQNYPYSPFFVLGIIYCLLGIALWPISFLGISLTTYLIDFHMLLMVGGFLFSFVAGFLLTAIPKFTGTKHTGAFDFWIQFILQLGLLLGLFLDSVKFAEISLLLSLSYLLFYILIRYMNKTLQPPKTFTYVLVALFIGIFSLSSMLVHGIEIFNKRLFEIGFILNIIMGIGGKVMVNMLGHDSFLLKPKKEKQKVVLVVCFNLCFLLDYFNQPVFADFGRFIFFYLFSLETWKLNYKPKTISNLTKGIWISLWFVNIGLFLKAIKFFDIAGLHIFFIAGMLVLTYFIATRVTLSHGGHNLSQEKDDKRYWWILLSGIVAAILRLSSDFFDSRHFSLLISLSFLSIILLVVLWIIVFGKKLINPIFRG